MPELPQHPEFIAAAYGIGVLVVAGLIGWIIADRGRQNRALADLEARGARRRSAAMPSADRQRNGLEQPQL
ncbi:MAG: heme exporter protein CcmD [Bauldia sp.]